MPSPFIRSLAIAGWLLTSPLAISAAVRPAPSDSPVPPQSAPRIDTTRTGSQVNWVAGQIEVAARGFTLGRHGAVQARSSAYALLANEARRAVASLRLNGEQTLAAVLVDEATRQRAEEMIARLVVTHETWDARTGIFTVVGAIPLYGQHGVTGLGITAKPSTTPVELPQSALTITAPLPRGHTPQRYPAPYTGIIVNGDAALLTSCLLPRLVRVDGNELWGPQLLSSADIINGPVHYASNLAVALSQRVAGDHPLVITAVGHAYHSYPVVNVDDAYLALSLHKESSLFSNLPVVITLGQRIPDQP